MNGLLLPLLSTCLLATATFLFSRLALANSDAQIAWLVPDELLRNARQELNPTSLATWQWTWSLGLIALLVLGWTLRVLPIAIVLIVIWLATPRWFLIWRLHQRRLLLRDQLVGCTQSLANSARAGQSLAQGLQSASGEMPEPLSGELRQLMAEYHLGRPLPEALLDAKERLKLDSFSMLASTIVVSLRRGGRVTESLERISHSLRENQRIERKLAAETAGGWRVVLILAVFPFLFLAGFYVVHPVGTVLMFQSWVGQALVILILMLIVASVWWSRKILNVPL